MLIIAWTDVDLLGILIGSAYPQDVFGLPRLLNRESSLSDPKGYVLHPFLCQYLQSLYS